MEFEKLLNLIADETIFETGLLLAGDVDPNNIRRQLSRWVKAGRVIKLRRGLYALAPPYQRSKPHPFYVANLLQPGSYVSCQSALAFYSLIPEYVPSTISVAAARPRTWSTRLGHFILRHLQPDYLGGYQLITLDEHQQAFVARPEKALLDLIYLTPGGETMKAIRSLRLQNLAALDPKTLQELTCFFAKPKIDRATKHILRYLQEYPVLGEIQ